jgi:hypothetical protein
VGNRVKKGTQCILHRRNYNAMPKSKLSYLQEKTNVANVRKTVDRCLISNTRTIRLQQIVSLQKTNIKFRKNYSETSILHVSRCHLK